MATNPQQAVSGIKIAQAPATRFDYSSVKKQTSFKPAVLKALTNAISRGAALPEVMQGDQVAKVIERALVDLGAPVESSSAVIVGIVNFAILTYGSNRAIEGENVLSVVSFELDVGVVNRDSATFLPLVFDKSYEQIPLRSFCRAFPNVVKGIFENSREILKVSFGVVDPYKTFASLLPKHMTIDHKFRAEEYKDAKASSVDDDAISSA